METCDWDRLKVDFLSLQRLLATIFFSKEISQVILAAISIVKIVCEWFQLWEEIRLKVVVRACYGAYLLRTFLIIFGTKFCFRETCTTPLFKISVQLSVEPLIAHAVCNSRHARTITWVYFYLITGCIQLYCFDRSVYS